MMLLNWIFPFLALLLVDGLHPAKLLPDFIVPCSGDPNMVKCPALLLEGLRHRLVQGIPELELPQIDPLLLPQVIVTPRGSAISDYTANITNMIWTGIGGFETLETYVNLDTLVFRLKLRFPYMHASADAFAEGTVLSFEMRGAGDFSCNTTNVVLDIVLNGERYERKGREFLKWKKEEVEMTFGDFQFLHMRGLFQDPTLSQFLMAALNKGIRLIGRSTKSFIVDSVGSFIIDSINRVHSLHPIDVLYHMS